ncbi:MAG: hypothetical protein LBE09_05450 [Christensenellaceae bacterium]|jgi:hypothetical protein|nr:hypothetical protein [Christensenellaceae bacterium]
MALHSFVCPENYAEMARDFKENGNLVAAVQNMRLAISVSEDDSLIEYMEELAEMFYDTNAFEESTDMYFQLLVKRLEPKYLILIGRNMRFAGDNYEKVEKYMFATAKHIVKVSITGVLPESVDKSTIISDPNATDNFYTRLERHLKCGDYHNFADYQDINENNELDELDNNIEKSLFGTKGYNPPEMRTALEMKSEEALDRAIDALYQSDYDKAILEASTISKESEIYPEAVATIVYAAIFNNDIDSNIYYIDEMNSVCPQSLPAIALQLTITKDQQEKESLIDQLFENFNDDTIVYPSTVLSRVLAIITVLVRLKALDAIHLLLKAVQLYVPLTADVVYFSLITYYAIGYSDECERLQKILEIVYYVDPRHGFVKWLLETTPTGFNLFEDQDAIRQINNVYQFYQKSLLQELSDEMRKCHNGYKSDKLFAIFERVFAFDSAKPTYNYMMNAVINDFCDLRELSVRFLKYSSEMISNSSKRIFVRLLAYRPPDDIVLVRNFESTFFVDFRNNIAREKLDLCEIFLYLSTVDFVVMSLNKQPNYDLIRKIVVDMWNNHNPNKINIYKPAMCAAINFFYMFAEKLPVDLVKIAQFCECGVTTIKKQLDILKIDVNKFSID